MNKLLYFLMVAFLTLGIVSCSDRQEETQKWEYKTLIVYGSLNGDFYSRTHPVPVEKLDTIGSQGWELVDVYTKIETVHPNFGNAQYVTGLQPNTRTSCIHYVFKRPVKNGDQKDTRKHLEMVLADENSEVVEATTDSIPD